MGLFGQDYFYRPGYIKKIIKGYEDMNKTVKERLSMLRARMTEAGGDICLITDNDPHISEYTGDHYKVREYFSGFTGSAGTLVVSLENAWLFTDGRYFVQAERELADTGIVLMKSGMPGVPTPVELIREQAYEASKSFLKERGDRSGNACDIRGKTKILTNGALLKAVDGIKLRDGKNTELCDSFDPSEKIWEDRPERKNEQIFPLDITFAGETAESKINRVKEIMRSRGCSYHVIASLEDIAWILNLRGSDIPCTPVFESFLVVGEETVLFVNETSLSEKARNVLSAAKVSTQSYDSIYDYISGLKAGSGCEVLIDRNRVNYRIISSLPEGAVKYGENPSVLMRAVKNDVEIRHLKSVHEDDGLCVTRLMYKIKSLKDADKPWTEAEAAACIDALRKISDHVSLSFPTISAFGANAAMMHYSAGADGGAVIVPGGMLLVDSGGQYLRGTTDVTRTFAVGEVPEEQKKAYTLALKGLLALTDAVFLKGTSGYGLDILARQFLWREGTDYRCGTGHGVGYMLNVHEGPNAFRYKYVPGVSEYCELEPGMVTTNEPGVYEEGCFGLRIENELLCVKAFENGYGEFLKFETLTLAPYDKDLILDEMLTEHERELIRDYHKRVYEVLSPRLDREEAQFLRELADLP